MHHKKGIFILYTKILLFQIYSHLKGVQYVSDFFLLVLGFFINSYAQ